jgi:hypothetical protein
VLRPAQVRPEAVFEINTRIGRWDRKVETVGRFGEMVMLRAEQGGHYEVGLLEESGDLHDLHRFDQGRPVSFTLTIAIKKLADYLGGETLMPTQHHGSEDSERKAN